MKEFAIFRRFVAVMIATLLMLVLVYKSATGPTFENPTAYSIFTPLPLPGYDREAAYVATQATLDYDQRQLMALSIQTTKIGQNLARAAATATYSANVLFAAQAAQTAEANASLTAYSLTATLLAAIQADIARTRG